MNDHSIAEICCLAAVRVGHVLFCYDSQKSEIQWSIKLKADLCVLKAGRPRPTDLIDLHSLLQTCTDRQYKLADLLSILIHAFRFMWTVILTLI